MASNADAPRVFISYSRDSPEHDAAVLDLVKQLQADGCTAIIDQDYDWVAEGWTVWMINQLEQANFVLVICTEKYKRRAEGKEDPPVGAGASWEGAIIRRDLYETNGRNHKFIPVLMRSEDKDHRPTFLRDYTYFLATDRSSYRKLCGVLKPNQVEQVPSPAIWQIPPANSYFSGREEFLENLHVTLSSGSEPAALTQAIKGLGGMGKTQTALKYAEIHRSDYTAGLWVVADSRENLLSGFAAFAQHLNLPGKDEADITKPATAAKRWFESNANWLLILDNLDDWSIARDWIPSAKRGHVLITTRLQSTGTFARGLDLPKMTADEGATFLLERGKFVNPSPTDISKARSISEELGGLPLGLEQAGAYIEDAKLAFDEYLELYRNEGKKLRARPSQSADHDTVTVTFSLAFARLGESARAIVQQAAFLGPDAIPEELLAGNQRPDLQFRDAVADGVKFSLISRNASTRTIDIHRLVQEVVKDTMDPLERRQLVERNIEALDRSFPDEINFFDWPLFDRLLSHAMVVTTELRGHSIESVGAARLLRQTGWYLSDRARYTEAEDLVKLALKINKKVSGLDHPDTAMSLNNLAVLYRYQGKYKEVGPLFEDVLEIRERVLGPDHPDTAMSLNNLAGLYLTEGKYKEAAPLYERALQIRERVLGSHHPATASSLNNLAELYRHQGRYQEAVPLFERALDIREKAAGLQHPDTAISLNSLARLYQDQGKDKEAAPLYDRALEIREKAMGLDHPDTAASLNNLAELYRSQGKYEKAEPLYERSLKIHEKMLGPDHPSTATGESNLAALYRDQGKDKEAEPLLKRALEIRELTLGPDHPDTASSLHALGSLYLKLGRFLLAEPLMRRTLTVLEKTKGIGHPDTLGVAKSYRFLLQKLGRRFEAHKLRQQFKL